MIGASTHNIRSPLAYGEIMLKRIQRNINANIARFFVIKAYMGFVLYHFTIIALIVIIILGKLSIFLLVSFAIDYFILCILRFFPNVRLNLLF